MFVRTSRDTAAREGKNNGGGRRHLLFRCIDVDCTAINKDARKLVMEDLLLNRRGHACPNRNQGDASSEVEMRCAQAFKLFDTLEAQHAAWILLFFPVGPQKGVSNW